MLIIGYRPPNLSSGMENGGEICATRGRSFPNGDFSSGKTRRLSY
jgi:hypothetical protein